MKMKIGDALVYNDSHISPRYGTGVVTEITPTEYAILWSGRGLTRYRRSILEEKLAQVFRRADKPGGLPKQRHLQLGASKIGVAFNENYDRAKIEKLCERLKMSGMHQAKTVATGLTTELFTKRNALREAAKTALWQLAELCSARDCAVCDEARSISRELFFGYVLQESDFIKPSAS